MCLNKSLKADLKRRDRAGESSFSIREAACGRFERPEDGALVLADIVPGSAFTGWACCGDVLADDSSAELQVLSGGVGGAAVTDGCTCVVFNAVVLVVSGGVRGGLAGYVKTGAVCGAGGMYTGVS